MYVKHIVHFFDKLEDKVRGRLSRSPIVYTMIGGFAIVLFWRGVWMTADMFPVLTGPVSIVISVAVLLITGLFVSVFIGDNIILSGVANEKKIVEKTENEIVEELVTIRQLKRELDEIRDIIKHS
jgi:hypothetical protein